MTTNAISRHREPTSAGVAVHPIRIDVEDSTVRASAAARVEAFDHLGGGPATASRGA
jgi:hypothetical protein